MDQGSGEGRGGKGVERVDEGVEGVEEGRGENGEGKRQDTKRQEGKRYMQGAICLRQETSGIATTERCDNGALQRLALNPLAASRRQRTVQKFMGPSMQHRAVKLLGAKLTFSSKKKQCVQIGVGI